MSGPWEPEPIPDEDQLFLRVLLRDGVDDDGRPKPVVFRNHPDETGIRAMSTDWSRYSTPADTQCRSRRHPPTEYGVLALRVGDVRSIPDQSVRHSPIFHDPEASDNPNNRAHTDVLGPKSKEETGNAQASTRIRARFAFSAEGVIAPPPTFA